MKLYAFRKNREIIVFKLFPENRLNIMKILRNLMNEKKLGCYVTCDISDSEI